MADPRDRRVLVTGFIEDTSAILHNIDTGTAGTGHHDLVKQTLMSIRHSEVPARSLHPKPNQVC
jgi:hypothetical protein